VLGYDAYYIAAEGAVQAEREGNMGLIAKSLKRDTPGVISGKELRRVKGHRMSFASVAPAYRWQPPEYLI